MAHTRMFRFDLPVPQQHEPTRLLRMWPPLVMVVATAEAVAVPLRIVLGAQTMPAFAPLDDAAMVVFFIDCVINFRRAAAEEKRSRTEKLLLAADVVAFLPLQLVFGWSFLAFFRCLKLVRVARWMSLWRRLHLNRWNALRLVYFVYWLSLFVHWLAAGWLALRGIPAGEDGWTRYLHSLYWCVSTLTTIGAGDVTPTTNAEILYSMAAMIVGVGMYGYVIANVATIITHLQPARTRHLENLEKLGAFMHERGIPAGLQHRIREYYSYIWEQRLGYDESSIIDGLPQGLRTDVALFLKRDIIQKVPLFAAASDDLVREIALQMQPVIFTPGDIVVRAGDPGREMYFIGKGELEVFGPDGTTPVAFLRDGDFFGENALLFDKPRNATIRAVKYCDVYMLDKSAFVAVVTRYPEFAHQIEAMTAERRGRNKGT